MFLVYAFLFIAAAVLIIGMVVGLAFKLIGFAVAALLVVAGVTLGHAQAWPPDGRRPRNASAAEAFLQLQQQRSPAMPSFVLYLLGFVILSAGILFGASILGVSNQWIAVIGLVLLGLGVITGVAKTRRRDASRRRASPRSGLNKQALDYLPEAPARLIATSSSMRLLFRGAIGRGASRFLLDQLFEFRLLDIGFLQPHANVGRTCSCAPHLLLHFLDLLFHAHDR